MRTHAIHPDLSRFLAGNNDLLLETEVTASYLCDLMKNVHGGVWSVSINHDACFVIVAQDFPVEKSNSGEN